MLQAPSTKHAFLHMNTFEKDKFLKFCNMSAGAKVREDGKEDPTMINELRINLTTEPYGVFYLEQIVSIEDIQYWDESDRGKVEFVRNCGSRMTQWSYHILNRTKKQYLDDFMVKAPASGHRSLVELASKLAKHKQA